MKHKIPALAAITVMTVLMSFQAFAAPNAEKKAYRAQASEIRQEIRTTNESVKAVNAEIKEYRTEYKEARKTLTQTGVLPDGVTEAEWAKIQELRQQITAINKAGKPGTVTEAEDDAIDESVAAVEAAADDADISEEKTGKVKSLVQAGNYDEALKVLTEKKSNRRNRLAKREEILGLWKQIHTLLH